jgi:hypothetical protein
VCGRVVVIDHMALSPEREQKRLTKNKNKKQSNKKIMGMFVSKP